MLSNYSLISNNNFSFFFKDSYARAMVKHRRSRSACPRRSPFTGGRSPIVIVKAKAQAKCTVLVIDKNKVIDKIKLKAKLW